MISVELLRASARMLATAAWLLSTACGGDDTPEPPRPPPPRGLVPSEPAAEQPEAPREDESEPRSERDSLPTNIPKYEPQLEQPEAEAEAEPEPRKYDEELAAAVGSPFECMKPRLADDAPPEVAVELEAYVLESGYVSRGSARSSFLDDAELDCVRRRVERARFGPDVEDAPRRVQARVTLTLRVTPDTTPPASTP